MPEKMAECLRAAAETPGPFATTAEIVDRTNLERDEVEHRLELLADRGYLEPREVEGETAWFRVARVARLPKDDASLSP